ncbi:unnamed protein product [Peniophora sp. CBMAI 1063]|nr:unnamed protein product [Peniophora sp. CBMAI 1063]
MSGPSRFSSLNSFFRSKTPNPPPPPPKDRERDNQSLYAQSAFSQSTRSFTIPRSTSPAPTTQTANSSVYHLGQGGASSSVLNLNQFGGGNGRQGQSSAPSSFKRGVSRIASGLKRPKSRANLLQDAPAPKPDDDGGISTPWNFQHNIHVDESFNGLPPSWSQTLLQAGYSEAEIAQLYDARRARTATPASTLRSASPAPSQNSLVPRARSSSLSRKRTDTAESSSQPMPPLPSLMGGPGPGHSRQESESSYAIVDPDESVSVQSDSQYVHLAHARNGQAVHAGVITPFPMPAQPSPNPSRLNGQGPHGSPSINGSYVGVNVSYGTANGTRATYSPSLHSTTSHTTNSSPRIPQARSDSRPQTPQRRTPFRVVNTTEGMGSPPPAYGNGRLGGENTDEELPGLTSADLARERPAEKQTASGSGSATGGTLPLRTGTVKALGNGNGVGLPANGIARRVESPEQVADLSRDEEGEGDEDEDDTTRFGPSLEKHKPPRLAPRLSLRPGALDLDDLGSWSSALLSSLPSASEEGPNAPPPSANNASSTTASTFSFASTSTSAPARRSKRFSRAVLPAIVLQDATASHASPSRTDEEDEEEDEGEGDITLGHSPLYNELLGMMGSSSSLSPSPSPTPSPSTSSFPSQGEARPRPPGSYKPPPNNTHPHLQLELSRHDSRSSSFAPRDSVASSADVHVDDYEFPVPPGSATSIGSGWPSPSEDTFAFRRQGGPSSASNRDTIVGLNTTSGRGEGMGLGFGGAGPSVRVEDEEEWARREGDERRDTLRPGWRESTATIMGNRASVVTVTDSNRLTLTIDERRRSGRDSNASGSTVTHATIVRGASVVRRVHASPVHLTPSEPLTEEDYLSSAPASPLSPSSPNGLAYRHRTQDGMLAPPLSQADEEDEDDWAEGDAEAEAEWARKRAAAEAEEEELSAEMPAPRRRPDSPDSNSEEGDENEGSGGTGSTGTTASAEDDSPPKVPPKSPSTANLSIGSARPSINVATDVLLDRPERAGVFSPSAGSGPASAAPSFSSLAPSPSHTISPQTQPSRPVFRAMDTDHSTYTDVSYASMITETDASGETRVSMESEVSDTQRVPLSAISGGFLSPTIPTNALSLPAAPQLPRNPGLTVSTAPSSFVPPAPNSASSLAPPGAGSGSGSVPPSPTPSLSRKRSSARASGLSRALKPLAAFLDASSDPRAKFAELSEIAQGESGSVFAARLVGSVAEWRVPATPNSPLANDKENEWGREGRAVALKIVPAAGNAVKLASLKRELELVRGVRHPNVLGFDGVFVDTDAESLWLAMELMERSLADVLSLSSPDMGLDPAERSKVVLSERLRARCVWDALLALSYLKKQRIAHRDLRSDNLLVSPEGVVKLADFGCAVRALPGAPRSSERVGVVYWQAPEMRTGLYDPLKVDVWSLGATAWELASGEPPFSDGGAPPSGYALPPLPSYAEASRAFEDFLHLCAQPPSSRAEPDELLNAHFVRMAAPRSALVALLGRCKVVEDRLLGRSDEA